MTRNQYMLNQIEGLGLEPETIEKIQDIVLEVIEIADYDMWKEIHPDYAEDDETILSELVFTAAQKMIENGFVLGSDQ